MTGKGKRERRTAEYTNYDDNDDDGNHSTLRELDSTRFTSSSTSV